VKFEILLMKNLNNSQDFRHQVNMYFDNALGAKEMDDLLQRVDTDPMCQKIFQKEKKLRNFIKSNVKRPSVSPELLQSIRDKIRVI